MAEDSPAFPLQAISPLCQIIFSRALPRAPQFPLLDPRPGSSDEDDVRACLLSLALVSKGPYRHSLNPALVQPFARSACSSSSTADPHGLVSLLRPLQIKSSPLPSPSTTTEFYYTSRPWLWRLLRIARPRGWVGVVHKLGGEQPGLRVSSEGDAFADTSSGFQSRAVSPARTSVQSSEFSQVSLVTPPVAVSTDVVSPLLQRTRSQSIERSSVFLSAQLESLRTSNSTHSPTTSSPDTSPERSRLEFLEGPHRTLERTKSRGESPLRRGDSLRSTRSPERIGRSRVRGDIPGEGQRGMSIDSLAEPPQVELCASPALSPVSVEKRH